MLSSLPAGGRQDRVLRAVVTQEGHRTRDVQARARARRHPAPAASGNRVGAGEDPRPRRRSRRGRPSSWRLVVAAPGAVGGDVASWPTRRRRAGSRPRPRRRRWRGGRRSTEAGRPPGPAGRQPSQRAVPPPAQGRRGRSPSPRRAATWSWAGRATPPPQGVGQLRRPGEAGCYDGTPCHRLTTQGIFVLQCGDPTGTGLGGPGYTFGPIENAPADDVYPAGTVAMATGRRRR